MWTTVLVYVLDFIGFITFAAGGLAFMWLLFEEVTGPGRVLFFSSVADSSVAVYPDSDKIGSRPADDADRLDFRRADAVGYWDGER